MRYPALLFLATMLLWLPCKAAGQADSLKALGFPGLALPAHLHYDELEGGGISYSFYDRMDTLDVHLGDSGLPAMSSSEFHRLFHQVDSMPRHNIWSLKQVETLSKEEYLERYQLYKRGYFRVSATVSALVLEIIDDWGAEMILYTVGPKLQLIDRLPIAFYCRSGTFSGEDGERFPWWAHRYCRIKKGLVVEKHDGNGRRIPERAESTYQIQEDGQLEKLR